MRGERCAAAAREAATREGTGGADAPPAEAWLVVVAPPWLGEPDAKPFAAHLRRSRSRSLWLHTPFAPIAARRSAPCAAVACMLSHWMRRVRIRRKGMSSRAASAWVTREVAVRRVSCLLPCRCSRCAPFERHAERAWGGWGSCRDDDAAARSGVMVHLRPSRRGRD